MDAPDKQPASRPCTEDGIKVDSVTLARLIEEVRNEGPEVGRNYDRTYNRHNR